MIVHPTAFAVSFTASSCRATSMFSAISQASLTAIFHIPEIIYKETLHTETYSVSVKCSCAECSDLLLSVGERRELSRLKLMITGVALFT